MYKYPSKRNTINNVDIESLAVDENDPETLLLIKEEMERFGKDYDIFTVTDIRVLLKLQTRKEAAEELGLNYDQYRQRLYRKIKRIRGS